MTQDGLWLSLLLHLRSHLNPLCSMVAETWLLLETDSVSVLECVFALFTQDGCQLFRNLPCVFSDCWFGEPATITQVTQVHLPLFSLTPPRLSLTMSSLLFFLSLITYYLCSKKLNMDKRICCQKLGMVV